MEELSHTKMKNCEYLGKAVSSPLMLGGRYTPRQWSCFQKFLSHQKWWRFWIFEVFAKTQKCLYLENCARWSEFNKIFDLLDISAEYPCQFSKYFCLAKCSSHFEFFAKIAKHKNTCILKTVLDSADYADFGCQNSIRLETEHFLNTLALTFISFSGRFVFAMQKH